MILSLLQNGQMEISFISSSLIRMCGGVIFDFSPHSGWVFHNKTFITCFYDFEFQLASMSLFVNIMSIFMGVFIYVEFSWSTYDFFHCLFVIHFAHKRVIIIIIKSTYFDVCAFLIPMPNLTFKAKHQVRTFCKGRPHLIWSQFQVITTLFLKQFLVYLEGTSCHDSWIALLKKEKGGILTYSLMWEKSLSNL